MSLPQDRAIFFGIDAEAASWIFSIMGVTNCLGRIVCGKIFDIIVQKFGEANVIYVQAIIMAINGFCKFMFNLIQIDLYFQQSSSVS